LSAREEGKAVHLLGVRGGTPPLRQAAAHGSHGGIGRMNGGDQSWRPAYHRTALPSLSRGTAPRGRLLPDPRCPTKARAPVPLQPALWSSPSGRGGGWVPGGRRAPTQGRLFARRRAAITHGAESHAAATARAPPAIHREHPPADACATTAEGGGNSATSRETRSSAVARGPPSHLQRLRDPGRFIVKRTRPSGSTSTPS
jgi:hypothetical protein